LDEKKNDYFTLCNQLIEIEKLMKEIEISGDIPPMDLAVIKREAYSL
jgi:hypothetical protein